MSLKDLALETLQNFDPKKDNPNQGEQGLPEGQYDVVVDKAGHRVYDSGFDAVAISVEVVQGDHTGRKELINIDLDGEAVQKYDFLMKKNIKLIGQLAAVTGVELTPDDWESENTVGDAFRHAVGAQFILHVEKSTNKAKTKEYTDYQFESYDDDDEAIHITDDDLPFD